MAWYWWILIAAGVVLFAIVKTKVSARFMKNMKKKQDEKLKRAEEDD